MQLSRRQFITSLGALAATVVVANSSSKELTPITPAQQKNLILSAESNGIIQNQVFHFNGPAIIENVTNLLITQCAFYCTCRPWEDCIVVMPSCIRLTLTHCYIKRTEQPGFYDYSFGKNAVHIRVEGPSSIQTGDSHDRYLRGPPERGPKA